MTEGINERVQHVNVKIFAQTNDIDISDAIPVFHRWIQDSVVGDLLIDVADYKHVPDGPGIMLIGYEADYSLDEAGGRLGLLYNRKTPVDGDTQYALNQAYQEALTAAKFLEEEPIFVGKLKFDRGDVEIIINDRLIAPNTDATWQALEPEIRRFFTKTFGSPAIRIERRGEPRDRFTVGVRQ